MGQADSRNCPTLHCGIVIDGTVRGWTCTVIVFLNTEHAAITTPYSSLTYYLINKLSENNQNTNLTTLRWNELTYFSGNDGFRCCKMTHPCYRPTARLSATEDIANFVIITSWDSHTGIKDEVLSKIICCMVYMYLYYPCPPQNIGNHHLQVFASRWCTRLLHLPYIFMTSHCISLSLCNWVTFVCW